jgi:hypothetical protein
MRHAISTDHETGSTRYQADDDINEDLSHDISYIELLSCQRSDYERQDVAKPKHVQMAQVSWFDARPMCEKLKEASDLCLRMEMMRRGYEIAGKILSSKYYDSGKHKKHKSKKRGHQK